MTTEDVEMTFFASVLTDYGTVYIAVNVTIIHFQGLLNTVNCFGAA